MSASALVRVGAGPSSKVANIALWLVQIAAAAMFVFAGWPKLAGDPKMVQLFSVIGAGQWFRYLTGSLEVFGAALLLIPATAGFGALLLAAVMVGAVLTHLLILGGSPAPALVLLVAVVVIAWGRRDRIRATLGR